ncbi:MAG: DNA polymerase III subunit gamma/tau [Firmicutes bacterium]|nr:DNA polymerase III subunit gamma/tau [Bacillota bacterium]
MELEKEVSQEDVRTGQITGQSNYQSLYRRYRPQFFSEIRGQEHVVRALKNSVQDGRVTHAYLFSGPRGTGKTSTARILAKALNCLNPESGEPCGKCESCIAVTEQNSFDVHELDAASSGRVEDIRELVSRASLSTPGRYKVYIIDEVHMLSTAASNALLKTLEEPPDHVVFVLATTDPQKVLPTIRSRTQHYEFHLLPDEVLDSLLTDVARMEGIEVTEGSLAQVRKRGKGSARDALSVLDRVVAGGNVDDDFTECIREVILAISSYDPVAVLASLRKAFEIGTDPKMAASLLVDELREMLLSNFTPTKGAKSKPATGQSLEDNLTKLFSNARLVNLIEEIGMAQVRMRDAVEPRITLEVTLLKLSSLPKEFSPEMLSERVNALESEVASLRNSLKDMGEARLPGKSQLSTPGVETDLVTPPAAREIHGSSKPALGAYLNKAPASSHVSEKLSDNTTSDDSLTKAKSAAAATSEKSSQPREAEPPSLTPVSQVSPPGTASVREDVKTEKSREQSGLTGPALRDQIVEIWGDKILPTLRLKPRAIYGGGRFVLDGENQPLFVFPNEATLDHAKPLRAEVAAAISKALGQDFVFKIGVEKSRETYPDRKQSPPRDEPVVSSVKDAKMPPDKANPMPERKVNLDKRTSLSDGAKEGKARSDKAGSADDSRFTEPSTREDFSSRTIPDEVDSGQADQVSGQIADMEYDFTAISTDDTISPLTLAVEHVLKVFPGAEEVER